MIGADEAVHPDVFRTSEIRWFRPGRPDVDPASIFGDGPGAPGPFIDSRTDLYLANGHTNLGIKLRGDADSPRLEIKMRASRRALSVGGSRGFNETWQKWSWRGPAAPSGTGLPAGAWIAVHKTRYQWTIHGDHEPTIRSGTDRSRALGGIEVTLLMIDDQQHWTFGAEVWGDDAEARSVLVAGTRSLLEALKAPGLEEESCGYAEWLTRLRR